LAAAVAVLSVRLTKMQSMVVQVAAAQLIAAQERRVLQLKLEQVVLVMALLVAQVMRQALQVAAAAVLAQ
jgi:hypothetical protein